MVETPRFSDEEWNGAYRLSTAARKKMTRLAAEHGLSYTHNPGGGEFNRAGFRCQIGGCDDVEDLETLEAALAGTEETGT